MYTTKKLVSALAVLTLSGVFLSSTYAEDKPTGAYPGYGMGPGMMRGWSGQEDWHGRGMMGPGMMYGQGMMGPGMMYGQGMMGPGMMYGYGPAQALNLNESQQKKMAQIQEELRKNHWDTMGKVHEEYAKLRELYMADKRDPDAIGKQMDRIYDLRRQMMVESVKAQNRMEEQLTDEQKKQWRSFYGNGWMMQ